MFQEEQGVVRVTGLALELGRREVFLDEGFLHRQTFLQFCLRTCFSDFKYVREGLFRCGTAEGDHGLLRSASMTNGRRAMLPLYRAVCHVPC